MEMSSFSGTKVESPPEDAAVKAGVDVLLRWAKAHGEVTDTTQRIVDLERMLSAAWEQMSEQQREAFLMHPEVLGVAEAGGEQ
jgi:hypothetical protein